MSGRGNSWRITALIVGRPNAARGNTHRRPDLVTPAVRPFTDKQIELVDTFADQAAIAIENVRLFESVEARTRELAASLENLRTTQDRSRPDAKTRLAWSAHRRHRARDQEPAQFRQQFLGVSRPN